MAHKKITISVSEDVFRGATRRARAAGLPLSTWVARLIDTQTRITAGLTGLDSWGAADGPVSAEAEAWVTTVLAAETSDDDDEEEPHAAQAA